MSWYALTAVNPRSECPASPRARHRAPRLLGAGQDIPGIAQEVLSNNRQLDVSVIALKKSDTQRAFQHLLDAISLSRVVNNRFESIQLNGIID